MTDAGCDERFLTFDCDGDACIGVLATGRAPGAARTGVVIAVGGPQYRVGSHRQFTLLARALAAAGVPALRFDYRGMGDSDGDARTFVQVERDLCAAIDAFERATGIARIVLWGLCDGASASMMYAPHDARVVGVVAVNPWARSRETTRAARLRHYYVQRLVTREFWVRLLSGKITLRAAAPDVEQPGSDAAMEDAAYLDHMARGWTAYTRPMLFLLSGNDMTAREFEAWIARSRALRRRYRSRVCTTTALSDADHTFSRRVWLDSAAQATVTWVRALDRSAVEAAAPVAH